MDMLLTKETIDELKALAPKMVIAVFNGPTPSADDTRAVVTPLWNGMIENLQDRDKRIAELEADVESLKNKKCVHDLAREYSQSVLKDDDIRMLNPTHPLFNSDGIQR